jgi:hypothetical protein
MINTNTIFTKYINIKLKNKHFLEKSSSLYFLIFYVFSYIFFINFYKKFINFYEQILKNYKNTYHQTFYKIIHFFNININKKLKK